MKRYVLGLPVYKKGDDLHECLNKAKNQKKAFEMQADRYISAAKICYGLAQITDLYPDFKVTFADTHEIQVSGPNAVLSKLVKNHILYIDVYDDENEDEDEEDEDEE